MAEVSGARLCPGDSFPNRDLVALRIAEEAIQTNTAINVTRSDSIQYRAVGMRFYIQANKNLTEWWVIKQLQVNVKGAGLTTPFGTSTQESSLPTQESGPTKNRRQISTTLQTEWLVALVLEEICERPGILN